MPETLDSTEERQLLDAVKRALDLVDQNHSPDDAIEKIAREEGYGPGKIKLIAHAYNNGKQLSQWHHDGNILDKLASFTLADPQRIIDRIYNGPSKAEKEAALSVDKDYYLPPSWLDSPLQEKKASASLPISSTPLEPYQRDPMMALNKAYAKIDKEKQSADECNRLASKAEDDVRCKVAKVVAYFKQASYNRIPFEHAEYMTRTYFGSPALPLMDLIYKQAKLREKRASANAPIMSKGISLNDEPFDMITAAIKAAEECSKLRIIAKEKQADALQVKESALRPFSVAGESKPSAQPLPVLIPGFLNNRAANIFGMKYASWSGEVAAIAAGDIIGQGVHEKLKEEEPELPDDELNDINEQKEISGIRNRVTLDTMLADPNNPLSKLPPVEVVNAYNKLIKAQPHIADKPAALQPLLEAHLGHRNILNKIAMIDLASLGVGAGSRMIGDIPKAKDKLIEDQWLKLEEPQHENELRKIRAHTILTQLLTDPEDPISGYDPDKVLAAYNEISAASPRVADNIHVLRPALRRKLEGHQEPFETKELLDIEKGLAQTRLPTPNTRILGDSPNDILG